MARATAGSDPLAQLASRLGLETQYWSWRGDPVVAGPDALLAAIRGLGHDVRSPDDAIDALAAVDAAFWAETAPPVVVAWDGAVLHLPLRVQADLDGDWQIAIELHSGRREGHRGRLFPLDASDHAYPGGRVHCLRHVRSPLGEIGYHRVHWQVEQAGVVRRGTSLIIAAPEQAWGAPGSLGRRWGVFAPVYALRGARSGGAGDLATLEQLRALVSAHGGAYVGTLPVLAAFLGEPMQASPYSPASRLFWNELYLDLDRAPGIAEAPAARALLASPEVAAERAALAAMPDIDYRRQYAWRRAVIDQLAEAAWAGPLGGPLTAYAQGRALDYALFRALGEDEGTAWSAWPAARRELPPPTSLDDCAAADVDLWRVRVHLYAQWAMEQQLAAPKAAAERGEAGLYLDLPVGVNADAYEVWRDRDLFMMGAAAGAPPDALFLGGQDWGLPPIHPERSRRSGHRYLIECVRHHMRHASMLRVDHVMGLHRLYCVPAGLSAKDGIYLRYPAEELYAILTLESHRHRCVVVGEDLGTVPDYVRPAMTRHGFSRLHVAQFAMPPAVGEPPGETPVASVASLNTHDTPTFAGWWRGCDVEDRLDLDLITELRAAEERQERALSRRALVAHLEDRGLVPAPPPAPPRSRARRITDTLGITVPSDVRRAPSEIGLDAGDPAEEQRAARGAMLDLADGPAEVVLVTLEDLWQEHRPQNVPGTSGERPNWRRPATRLIEDIVADPAVAGLLDEIAARRRRS
jgi:4-alpha-glucanotransferase